MLAHKLEPLQTATGVNSGSIATDMILTSLVPILAVSAAVSALPTRRAIEVKKLSRTQGLKNLYHPDPKVRAAAFEQSRRFTAAKYGRENIYKRDLETTVK